MSRAYYNEYDPKAAAWLREAIPALTQCAALAEDIAKHGNEQEKQTGMAYAAQLRALKELV